MVARAAPEAAWRKWMQRSLEPPPAARREGFQGAKERALTAAERVKVWW
jgi:hypothetical protein